MHEGNSTSVGLPFLFDGRHWLDNMTFCLYIICIMELSMYELGILYTLQRPQPNSIIILRSRRHLVKTILDKYNIKYKTHKYKMWDNNTNDYTLFVLKDGAILDGWPPHYKLNMTDDFIVGVLDARGSVTIRKDKVPRINMTLSNGDLLSKIGLYLQKKLGTQIYMYSAERQKTLRIHLQSYDVYAIYKFLPQWSQIRDQLWDVIKQSSLQLNKDYICVDCGRHFIPSTLTRKYSRCPACLNKMDNSPIQTEKTPDELLYEAIHDYFNPTT